MNTKINKITILDNGLKIITSYTPRLNGVHISLWLKTGSRYENSDERGFSHLLNISYFPEIINIKIILK